MDYDEKRTKVREVMENSPAFDGDQRALSEAVHSASELGLIAAETLDPEDAVAIWSFVESVRRDGFPEELRM